MEPLPFPPLWALIPAVLWLATPIAQEVVKSTARWWWKAPIIAVQLAAIGVAAAALASVGTHVIMAVEHAETHRDSDGSPQGRDREDGLDGEAATARAEGIAQRSKP